MAARVGFPSPPPAVRLVLPMRHPSRQAQEASLYQRLSGGTEKTRVIISLGVMATNSGNQALLQDIWQKIPPEEKSAIVSRAQSTAISAILVLLMFGWAMAIGMREQWYFWGTFLIIPFAFQIATSKAWHSLKPKLIIEYTAARATACFYAQQANGQKLLPTLQFKGFLERQLSDNQPTESDLSEEMLDRQPGPIPVWVTLFPDSLVIFSETPFGSHKEFAHSISEDISVGSEATEEEFGEPRRVSISVRDEAGAERRWILTSTHATQLTACERKLQQSIERRNALLEQHALARQAAVKQEVQAALEA
jgi:hypothetical protein